MARRLPGRGGGCVLALALALGVAAQAQSPAQPQPGSEAADPAEAPPPAAPAPAPPPAAVLAPQAAPSIRGPDPRAPLAAPLAGLEVRAEGGWRLRFADGAGAELTGAALASLGELGRRLATPREGRVTVIAQVSGPARDVSIARRLSLARGIAVKQALAAGGLDETRIDIRPMGRTEEAVDTVDVLPPAPPRAAPSRTAPR